MFEEVKAGENNDDDDAAVFRQQANRYGVGGIDRLVAKPQNRYHYSYCPIHIAVENDHRVSSASLALLL